MQGCQQKADPSQRKKQRDSRIHRLAHRLVGALDRYPECGHVETTRIIIHCGKGPAVRRLAGIMDQPVSVHD